MAVTLTIADDATIPTGAVATVSGAGSGSVVLYIQKVNGTIIGSFNWSVGGTRTGNGTIDLTLNVGYYFAYCTVDAAEVSTLVYFNVTNGQDSVATRCREAIKATIQLLDPVLYPCSVNVYTRWHPSDQINYEFPCVIMSTEGQRETELPYTQGLDDVGRPTLTIIADSAQTRFDPDSMPAYELWRQGIQRLFIRQRLSGVIECKWCEIEPANILNDADYKGMVVVSAFNIRVRTREPRGLGA